MKNITLCADDYGQNTAISQAIIALLKEKKLSATSCITTTPDWLMCAAWLLPIKNQADIGVHFNLTHGKPLSTAYQTTYGDSFFSLSTLIKKCYLRELNPVVIHAELSAQLDQFISGVGGMPDFIDGHQHIHQFPVIRDAILALYQQRLRDVSCYVRCVNDSAAWCRLGESAYIKRIVIQLCGASIFKRQLEKHKIPHNNSFAGIYDFNHAKSYAKIFPRFLQQSLEGGLIMCHPGLSNSEEVDEINQSRSEEYRYFQSEAFLHACEQNKVMITRFLQKKF